VKDLAYYSILFFFISGGILFFAGWALDNVSLVMYGIGLGSLSFIITCAVVANEKK
jgi:thiamine transporter ThiT